MLVFHVSLFGLITYFGSPSSSLPHQSPGRIDFRKKKTLPRQFPFLSLLCQEKAEEMPPSAVKKNTATHADVKKKAKSGEVISALPGRAGEDGGVDVGGIIDYLR